MASTKTLEDKLVENLVALQKVHTDLAEKFDKLSGQIANLLALFEISARTIASNPATGVTEKDREFLDKIDKLLEQNKVIAKGLTLMEGKMRERLGQPPRSNPASSNEMQESKPNFENSDDSETMTPSIKVPDVPRPLPKY